MPINSITPAALALVSVFVIALVVVVRLAGPSRPALPYRKKPLLSPWERTALPTLLRQLGSLHESEFVYARPERTGIGCPFSRPAIFLSALPTA